MESSSIILLAAVLFSVVLKLALAASEAGFSQLAMLTVVVTTTVLSVTLVTLFSQTKEREKARKHFWERAGLEEEISRLAKAGVVKDSAILALSEEVSRLGMAAQEQVAERQRLEGLVVDLELQVESSTSSYNQVHEAMKPVFQELRQARLDKATAESDAAEARAAGNDCIKSLYDYLAENSALKQRLSESQQLVDSLQLDLALTGRVMGEKVELLTSQLRVQEATLQRLHSQVVVVEAEADSQSPASRRSRASRSSAFEADLAQSLKSPEFAGALAELVPRRKSQDATQGLWNVKGGHSSRISETFL